MPAPQGAIHVRPASPEDMRWVRALVVRALLDAGYDLPGVLDEDLDDPGYYEGPGRGLWVAYDDRDRLVGCVALDRGDQGSAVVRRFAGTGLYALIAAAVQQARRQRYRVVETVLTPGMDNLRLALEAEGFAPSAPGSLLYRRELAAV
ncbi:MAG: GNAT family N-acetyltransferase [Dehalococcoidia bacterium]|nr:GNAT family N-acetyltransferase [Dehalococcoidia bacterium]